MNEHNQLPKGESVEFEDFVRVFIIWSIPVCIAISYSLPIFPESYILYAVDLIPFEERVEYLRRVDQKSYVAFVATALSGSAIFTFVVVRLSREYWRRFVAVGKCKYVRTEVLLVMMRQFAFGAAIFSFFWRIGFLASWFRGFRIERRNSEIHLYSGELKWRIHTRQRVRAFTAPARSARPTPQGDIGPR